MPTSLTTSQTDKTLTFKKHFNAPKELVFDAFTKPEHLKNWWMPWPYTVPEVEIDLRVGGEWRYTAQGPKGDRHFAKAVYDEVERPDKLVFHDFFTNEDGTILKDLPGKKVTISFISADGGTDLSVLVELESEAKLKALVQMQFVPGFTTGMSQLEELLVNLQK